ncbi:GNAT family N-acetyltransferase [Heyndrickxia sporothermodurans]|uniref:GNAT family N-acetyltransferase n=1 Tax=Heyndrickxia sporothermodurans TaxID=46224 RepID=UPI0035DB82B5
MIMNIFTSLDEFFKFYEIHKKALAEKDPLFADFVFTVHWYMVKSPEEKPFIALYEDNSMIRATFFSCAEVKMKKLIATENGTRKYEHSPDLPVYKRAYTFQALYNVSEDFFNIVTDALFDYPVDAILLYVYKEDYEKLKSFLGQNKLYNYYANCYSHAFEGEIGHNRFDSMRLILPNTLEEVFQPFHKKKQHHYNFRRVKKVHRIAKTQLNVQYKYISPSSEIQETDLDIIFSDIEYIYKNSWQSELNSDNHKEKLAFLHKHKKLMLLLVYADGIPASYFYGYVNNGEICESWMAYNSEFSPYSFGLIALVQFLKLCIDTQIKSIEFGGTTHKYKKDLVNKTEPIHEIVVFNPTSSMSRELKLIKRFYPKALI